MTEVELSRRERKKEETKERIFRAAVKLFRDKGFEATTIDDITDRADVAKGTFFNYFHKKEAVLGYLSAVRLAAAEERAEEILAAPTAAREKLIELLGGAAAGYEENPELSRFVVIESMQRALAPSEEVHRRWHSLVVRVLEQGRRTRELRGDVDVERAAFVLSTVYMGTLMMWLCGADRPECSGLQFNLQDELRARLSLVIDGLAA
jgi:AcrR family transcriptional regulator